MKWIRYSDELPPVNTDILVLVNGEIHEGYLDSVLLMGKNKATIFETLYTNRENSSWCSSAQHSHWGDDPYWMPIPCEKPIQIKSTKPRFEVLGERK